MIEQIAFFSQCHVYKPDLYLPSVRLPQGLLLPFYSLQKIIGKMSTYDLALYVILEKKKLLRDLKTLIAGFALTPLTLTLQLRLTITTFCFNGRDFPIFSISISIQQAVIVGYKTQFNCPLSC